MNTSLFRRSSVSCQVARLISQRRIHVQPPRSRRRDLIGPPHPITHLRPVIYDVPPTLPQSTQVNHPYSLTEFTNASEGSHGDLELQYKLQLHQLDAFNHQFWLDSNTRFEAAKNAILEALPESASTLDREHALSHFYKQWLVQESERTNAYTREWRKRNLATIILGARVEYQKFCKRLSSLFSRRKAEP
ncbi:hypothetical protein AMATHDRAFT_135664 [Amanita thiersii Skay4041]|uniref:Uncharacterized protein n=1 Tax=Amanita thiersii Skay4041 TaxID=703135 RepID=A0A2A9P1A3_9AGAR|nr:hypothetical protein AMATHDRAFT_135664 [Amanita thiersii Skay4041]